MKAIKYLSVLLVLCLLICLLPAAAMADPDPEESADGETGEVDLEETQPAEEPEDTDEDEEDGPITVWEEETGYAAEGETVYNNGGTVYNNGGVVYNNGGLVYANGGVVYNNGGKVYANGGTVYNNGGTVYRNDALVYTFDDDVVDSHIYGYYRITLAGDYEALVELDGLADGGFLAAAQTLTITPREGLELTAAEADAGTLTENEDGSYALTEVDADVTLTLTFRAQAPVLALEEGTYSQPQTLTITAPEGLQVYYTLDGTEPDAETGLLYEEPIELSEGVTVTAVALFDGAEPSETVTADYAFVTITAPEFEDADEGDPPPAAAAFTLENPGSVDAVIKSVVMEGDDVNSFTLNSKNGATVKAGTTDEKTWTVRPVKDLEKGTYTVTVIFTLDSGETVKVPVTFTVK